jgi:hypothetical protein
MICNDYNNSNEVILRCDFENKNNSINSIHDVDIENGLYYVYNSKKNNLISIISNVSYMSYNFLKNMKDMIYKKIKN